MTSDLLGKTTYRRPSLREDAPLITDCLTSVYYIFKKALGLAIPLTFIGDMPRRLCSFSEWRAMKIDIKDVLPGDVLFVKNIKNMKLLSHVAVVLGTDKIFHCCPSFGTAVIQTIDEFFSLYEQHLSFKEMIRYIDPRNEKLRKEQNGIFIFN